MKFYLFLAICLLKTSIAAANPWLLEPGTVVISGTYDYSYANQEFLASDGTLTDFSLNGEYQATSYTLAVRMGISERFELEMSLPLKSVSYRADPLILLPSEQMGQEAFDYYQENIINFNQTMLGFGDLNVAGRFRVSVYPIASSIELKITAPTGYRKPQGTFGSAPTDIDTFVENAADIARPENIRDDVTLGDGVLSFQPIVHLGFGTSSGFFTRLSAGLMLRNQGAGEILTSEFKLGQFIKPWLLVYGGGYFEKTVISGKPIGVSVASEDPALPASEYIGLNNLKPIIVSLDRDLLVIPIGVLLRPTDKVDVTCTYSPLVWGRNVAKSHTMSIGVNIQSELF